MVEATHDLARQLQVRELVATDGDLVRLVERDIGRLQHGVADQAVVDVVGLLPHLLLEGRHSQQPAVRHHHAQHQVQLGHLRHMALHVEDRPFRVDPGREQIERRFEDVLLQLGRLRQGRQRVIIDDGVNAGVLVL